MRNKHIDFKVIIYFLKGTKTMPENVFISSSNKVGPCWAAQKAW